MESVVQMGLDAVLVSPHDETGGRTRDSKLWRSEQGEGSGWGHGC